MLVLGLVLAILVPVGMIIGIVVLNRSQRRIERDGADYGGFGSSDGGSTWYGSESGTSHIGADSGGRWDSGDTTGCDTGDSGGFSSGDSGGSSDGGGSSGGCD